MRIALFTHRQIFNFRLNRPFKKFYVRSRTLPKTSCTFLSNRNDCHRFPTAHASGIDSSKLDT